MNAKWITDYDIHTDKCYQRPGCPECEAPVGMEKDGKYRCFSCGEEVKVADPNMLAWFNKRNEKKIRMEDCKVWHVKGKASGCGGKGCVESMYVRNPVTMEWQFACSTCRNCGRTIIV